MIVIAAQMVTVVTVVTVTYRRCDSDIGMLVESWQRMCVRTNITVARTHRRVLRHGMGMREGKYWKCSFAHMACLSPLLFAPMAPLILTLTLTLSLVRLVGQCLALNHLMVSFHTASGS